MWLTTEFARTARPIDTPRQHIRFIESHDGTRLAYAASGSGGPVVIKCATWLSHLERDWISPVWRHLLSDLSGYATLIRYDERGCGLSDWDVDDLGFETWVRDLEIVERAVGAETFVLLGISQGAAVAIAYAARYPDRVDKLVLHGGYARGRLVRSGTAREREEAELMCRLAELGWGKEDTSFRQFFTTQFIPGGTPDQHQWFNEMERVSTSPENAARFMREFNEIDVQKYLAKVECPTLVLHSARDVRVPFDEGRRIATAIRGAELVSIDSPNHLLLRHEPGWARWSRKVRAFLTEVDDGPSAARFEALTTRQREILELVAQGRDNAQIAARLELAEKTIRNQVSDIFRRLEVENRAQAIVLAREAGFGTQR